MYNIKECPSYEVVTESFRKHRKKFSNSQSNLKVPQFKQEQLEISYAIKSINIEYKQIFEKEAQHIYQSIAEHYLNHPDSFPIYLLENYKVIKELYNQDDLIEPLPIDFVQEQISNTYIQHVMEGIKYRLQYYYVVPTMNLIENNYLQLLLEENVFPVAVKDMLYAINNDRLQLKDFKNRVPEESQFAVFSQIKNCFYFLEYNSFTDIISYRSYLDEIYTQFEEYLNQFSQIIAEPKERIKFYNKIKTYLTSSLSQFDINPKQKVASHSHLPNFIRKDTLIVLKQYIKDSFMAGREFIFNPCLCDFQDLQYGVGKKALFLLESKIKFWQFDLEINSKSFIVPSDKTNELPDTSKIRTELTVPQLAFLFRCLFEEEDIIDEKNKSALFRSISTSFTSKHREDISAESIRVNFNSPSEKTIEFCIEKFTHFLQFAKEERENRNI